jgi:HK97 family phage prohead protease
VEFTIAPVDGFEVRESGDSHEIEGICVPYGEVTHRAGPRPELFEPGAFADLATQARGSGVRLFLYDNNHDLKRVPAGTAVEFRDQPTGLWGRFRFHRTVEGRGAFDNLAEGVYSGLSIGFQSVRDRVVDGVRRVAQARLHHVSLVTEPAYEGAQILALRGADDLAEQWARIRGNTPTLEIPRNVDTTPFSVMARRTRRG